ncbi:N-acetylmuramoyl-L-alanine amidase [Streptomyces sp. NPDC004539]|uniref:N-acetylmuramoyl-L-alanine amidase n=1 Tax=Streptomyces sp. NPDC004539 TaxID=3154280 RepID=UPI0033A4B3B7
MKLVTRAQLGWPASAAPTQTSTKGVKVHYEGTDVSPRLLTDHDACIAEWKAIRVSHLNNKKENYSDVAYNYAACPHGYLLEGRGIGKRTGANGDQDLNRAHYAIVGLVGDEGLTEPTDAMLGAIRDGIELLREHGAGTEIKGHRDGYATDCPGGPLYAWVQRGAPRPGGTVQPPSTPAAPPFPGRSHFVLGAHNDFALQLQKWLAKGGWGPAYKVGPSRTMTQLDLDKVKALQRHYLSALGPADGLTGPKTWQYAYEVANGLRKK